MASKRSEPRAHICPPSDAIHPSGRWESLFVYAFICKFTNLCTKVDGLESPMDLEASLMTAEANPVLMPILKTFILNLRPLTRNLGIDQISSTVSSILADYFRTAERSVFWDDSLQVNVDPLHDHKGSFFELEWDLKLKILRQLVELQLCHSADIKGKIDRAWGVAPTKSKKKESHVNDIVSQDDLLVVPIGQDASRKRYWVADASPRVYVSSNPWKTTATFATETSTREEYMALLERLKRDAPNLPESSSRPSKSKKPENQLVSLIKALEERVPVIDAETARKEKVRRKAEQKLQLFAQAELRETRTRRQAKKPDYRDVPEAESDDGNNDDGDDYTAQNGQGYDDEDEEFINDAEDSDGRPAKARRGGVVLDDRRRSTRTSARNANGKRASSSEDDPWAGLRDEPRRSTRFGNADVAPLPERPAKRARTVESNTSMTSGDAGPSSIPENGQSSKKGLLLKTSGAAALKPTEVAVAEIPGKKKSKFWVYAVEPAVGSVPVNTEKESLMDMNAGVGNGNLPKVNGYESISTQSCKEEDGNVKMEQSI